MISSPYPIKVFFIAAIYSLNFIKQTFNAGIDAYET